MIVILIDIFVFAYNLFARTFNFTFNIAMFVLTSAIILWNANTPYLIGEILFIFVFVMGMRKEIMIQEETERLINALRTGSASVPRQVVLHIVPGAAVA
jgi:hypothetical protein